MRVLLVEDDRKAAKILSRGLQEEGFVVDVAHSAEHADEQAWMVDYDLILLDWMLPEKEGIAFCGDLRGRGVTTPILMLTAKDTVGNRVAGLNTGADDYLTKPFAFEELLARIHALLRRSEMARPVILTVADLTLDPQSHRVMRGGIPLNLTAKEYAILETLMRRPGEVVSRSRLAEQIWISDQIGLDNLIDAHISNLRRKVDIPGANPLIHTVRGRGFRLALEENGRA
ncbi:response regulator transcription factor [Methyloterricola oryzae]|uniref:response regulator transcription factor n=1 Tax=Methyloterricola oryzae TaxID=1495050 RepID=UPI0005EB20FF|nr:response regulator transcription factor [Methyloterricola oryzae]